MTRPLDLIIVGGTLLDGGAGSPRITDVGIRDGVIAALGPALDRSSAAAVIEAAGCYVTPGLVDLHSHVYWGVNEFGIECDPICLRTGVTTAVDAGSAGAVNFPGLRRYVVDQSQTRVLAFVNLALHGVQKQPATELRDPAYADPERAAKVAREHRDAVVGIKVRLSTPIVGGHGSSVLHLARRAADAAGCPLMVHIGDTALAIEEILVELRPGDIVTHCYTGQAPSIVDDRGWVRDAARAARERGVIFDVGHGAASFSYAVATAAIDQGFPPDCISSDLHAFCVDGPVHDLPTTMSKFVVLGMSVEQVVEASTAAPARAIGRGHEIGRIEIGREADVAVLAVEEGEVTLPDSAGREFHAQRRLAARWTVRAGRVFPSTP